jgi:hypothetical protein
MLDTSPNTEVWTMLDRIVRVVLILLTAFLGLTAVFGAVSVVPTMPLDLLAGTPFADYTVPALSLGLIGIGALAAAALLVVNPPLGVRLSIVVGAGIAIFEIVETLVVGLDVWLHALGLGPEPAPIFAGEPVASLLGIPIPLWLQPLFLTVGAVIIALALRLVDHETRSAPHVLHEGGASA